MRRLVVDIVEKPTVSYQVRIGRTSTDLAIECTAAGLRTLKSCIETTLEDPRLAVCSPNEHTAVAIYPVSEGEPTYRLVVDSEAGTISVPVRRRRLAEFVSHDIESAIVQ